MKKIVIIAGDKSGDLYGGSLSKSLREKFTSLKIYSFGGETLAAHSEQITDLTSHSVCGLLEVILSLKKFLDIFKNTLKTIHEIKPDLIILIDFPDFNIRLAKKLNRKYPIFYYVSPQIWAWRKKRINLIKKYIDRMVVIFKFEESLYKKENIDVSYFGHPLLEIIKNIETKQKNIISFLPGSRKNEIHNHLPVMLKTKEILEQNLSGYNFRILKPKNLKTQLYKNLPPNIAVIDHSYLAIKESKFIIAACGTATIETSILKIPYLIIYKVNPLSWQILKRMVNTKFIGMVNILAGKKVVEELLQNEANPQKIASSTLKYLRNTNKYSVLENELKNIRPILSPENAIDKFSNFIGEYLKID